MVGVVPDHAAGSLASSRILEPIPELRPRRATLLSVAIEHGLKVVVDKNHLRLSSLQPVSHQCPLRTDQEIARLHGSHLASAPAATALEVDQIGVATVLMAAVSIDPTTVPKAQVVHSNTRRSLVPPPDRVEGVVNPLDGLLGTPGTGRRSDDEQRVPLKPSSVSERAIPGPPEGLR